MLGKLLKYDFRALSRVMLPLQLSVLVAGVLGCFLVNFSWRSLMRSFDSSLYSYSEVLPLESVINASTSMLAGLFFAVVFASYWVSLFLVARHLYKSFLKDEGYLTFTLPVSGNQHMLSKTISGSIWLVINALILTFIVVLLTLVGFSDTGLINLDVLGVYKEVFSELSNASGMMLILECLLIGLTAIIASVLMVYFSLILGGVLARTYKVLAGIGIFVAVNIVVQTIMSFVAAAGFIALDSLSSSLFFSTTTPYWFVEIQPIMLPALILEIGFIITFFLVSKYLINNKLNLE